MMYIHKYSQNDLAVGHQILATTGPSGPPLSKPCFVDQHVELFWLTRATLAAGAWLEGRRAAATAAPPVRSHETEQKSTLNILLDSFNPVIMLHVSEQNFITSQCAIYTSSVSASSCQHRILSGKAGEAPLQQVNHRTSQHLRCKWIPMDSSSMGWISLTFSEQWSVWECSSGFFIAPSLCPNTDDAENHILKTSLTCTYHLQTCNQTGLCWCRWLILANCQFTFDRFRSRPHYSSSTGLTSDALNKQRSRGADIGHSVTWGRRMHTETIDRDAKRKQTKNTHWCFHCCR